MWSFSSTTHTTHFHSLEKNMEFSTFVVVVFYFFVVVINLCSFFAVLLVGLVVQIINYLQLKWFVTKLTVTYMFKRVIFSQFTPKYIITIWLGLWGIIPVWTIIFNIWRRCLSWFGQYRNAAVIIITFVLFLTPGNIIMIFIILVLIVDVGGISCFTSFPCLVSLRGSPSRHCLAEMCHFGIPIIQ